LSKEERDFGSSLKRPLLDRTDAVDDRKVSIENLDLPPGYSAENSEAGVYLVDPDGRKVMRLPGDVALADPREAGHPDPWAEPEPGGWQELCRLLLIRLSEKNAECERLRARLAELGERLEAAEAERDQANAIAEDLYAFFRNRVRETMDRKERTGRGSVDVERAEYDDLGSKSAHDKSPILRPRSARRW
jgi:hypothetical protein